MMHIGFLPVEAMADRERATATLRTLRGRFVARHEFILNGDTVTLDVAEVQAMAQPAGAFFAWGLNDEGRWMRGKADLKAPIAVCDVGFNTLDLFAVQREVVARFTGGDTAGMRRAKGFLEIRRAGLGDEDGGDVERPEAAFVDDGDAVAQSFDLVHRVER